MSKSACRFLIRTQPETEEVLRFVVSGLEVGQQVAAIGGPTWLKDLAAALNDKGFRSDSLLRSGRLVFMTAPLCFMDAAKPNDGLAPSALRRVGSILRWVSDWTWAYGNGISPEATFRYQRRVHRRTHELGALSMCTAHFEPQDRKLLLATLMDHRRSGAMPGLAVPSPALHIPVSLPV